MDHLKRRRSTSVLEVAISNISTMDVPEALGYTVRLHIIRDGPARANRRASPALIRRLWHTMHDVPHDVSVLHQLGN